MEMVAATVNMLNGHVPDANNATVGNIEAHALTGLTPMLNNASGYLWTAAYINETGDQFFNADNPKPASFNYPNPGNQKM